MGTRVIHSLRARSRQDRVVAWVLRIALASVNVLTVLIAVGLLLKSMPILRTQSLGKLLLSSTWKPLQSQFGLLPFLSGTIATTVLAMLLAVPVCLLSAVYLAEYARSRVRNWIAPVIDLLAGIPSVVYGLWGVLVIVPAVRVLGKALGYSTTGYSLLAGATILGIMVAPIIISICTEVLRAVPTEARETALALGLTRWEVTRHVVLCSSRRGILAAVVLGFARAAGETMAVLMVVGNVPRVPSSLFAPAYPLPALIANNYGEMMSIPMYDSALMMAAFVLLVVVALFNLAARLALLRFARDEQ